MITKLDDKNFSKETERGLKLIEFYADWCGFCTRQKQALEELDKIWIGQVNTDENKDIAQKYKISSLPSFVLLKDGKEVDRFSGLHSKFDLMNIIMHHMK